MEPDEFLRKLLRAELAYERAPDRKLFVLKSTIPTGDIMGFAMEEEVAAKMCRLWNQQLEDMTPKQID